MKKLNEIVRESVEKFDEGCIGTYTRVQRARSHLISSQISLLEAELERKKGRKDEILVANGIYEQNKVYPQGCVLILNEDITYLTEQLKECRKLLTN